MLLRLRSRDGLERIQVDDKATVQALRQAISSTLGVPADDMVLSRDAKLLTSSHPEQFRDLASQQQRLQQVGLAHGDLVYMHTSEARTVQPAVKRPAFGSGLRKMTVDQLIAKQTRIERQEEPHCASVSFDGHAANAFQQYIQAVLAFSIKRGAILYGTRDEQGNVMVQAIYEPPQEGQAEHLQLGRHTEEEKRADFIAQGLRLEKVGWIFTQSSTKRDYILSTEEVCQMAAWQDELGEHAVTGVVSLDVSDEGSNVHFEAFQVSDQCVRLVKDGWFDEQKQPSGVSVMTNPKEPKQKQPVIVAGKDVKEVDNDYFLIPVKILDHEGPLLTSFAIENRLTAQGQAELREHLMRHKALSYSQRLRDFHLLLWLSKQAGLDLGNDIATLLETVHHKAQVPEGYTLIIDSLAGM